MPFLFGELSLAGRAKLIIRTIQTRGHQDTFVGLSVRHCSSSSRSDKHRIVENWSTGGYICRWGHPFFCCCCCCCCCCFFCCFFWECTFGGIYIPCIYSHTRWSYRRRFGSWLLRLSSAIISLCLLINRCLLCVQSTISMISGWNEAKQFSFTVD